MVLKQIISEWEKEGAENSKRDQGGESKKHPKEMLVTGLYTVYVGRTCWVRNRHHGHTEHRKAAAADVCSEGEDFDLGTEYSCFTVKTITTMRWPTSEPLGPLH